MPVSQCAALGIKPGDEVESFVAYGQLTIVIKKQGANKANKPFNKSFTFDLAAQTLAGAKAPK